MLNIIFQAALFIVSCVALSLSGKAMINTLVKISRFLNLREFVVGFFIMAFATSTTNMFVDINAAISGIPEMAFGDIVGGNLVDLTLVMALAVFFSKKGISTKSSIVQSSAAFTTLAAILPLLLILDGKLNRIDGAVLLLVFIGYSFWLFSKKDNFKKIYKYKKSEETFSVLWFIKNAFMLFVFISILLGASFIIVDSAQIFATALGIPIALVGILIVGLGNCFPEGYFAIISAKKGEGWLVLGNLMGSVIVSTLVLGTVVLINPIENINLSPFLTARIFMMIAIIFYLFAIRSDKKITKKEAIFLLLVYIIFLITEIFLSK